MSADSAQTAPSPHVEPLFEAGALAARVAELGREIDRDLAPEDPLLLALLGGSVIFLADLVRAIERPFRFEFVSVGASDAPDAEVTDLHYPIPVELEGQNVLLVKDVVASGIVETYLQQQIRSRGAASVRLAALIDLPDERKTELRVDYHAFSAHRVGTLVGYGLKHQGRWGNLPFVGRLAAGA
ncbi:MAG TPA: phosphoribosyltransferase family protein [Thermoanaerobaculia bacterium]|nr:phosphoribosyltransferase family protein [Thermoanaerobaculia bacterium]